MAQANMLLALVAVADAGYLAKWNQYVNDTLTATEVQPSCVPRRYPASNSTGPARGVVVLFHGFTACPQQYWQLAPLIAARGFDVLLPLTPGHGNPVGNASVPAPALPLCIHGCGKGAHDDASGLPTTVAGYESFVARISDIARAHAGPMRAVGGLSLGGALAAAAGQESLSPGAPPSQSRSLFSRQLIINPLFDLSNELATDFARLANYMTISHTMWLGWGDECFEERAGGRGGLCDFQVRHGAASRDFGQGTADNATNITDATVALLYDTSDAVISNGHAREWAAKAGAAHCVMPFNDHSALSRFDDLGMNKWWMNELSCKIVDFFASGTVFAVSINTNPDEGNDHVCRFSCNATACPYDPKQPLSCPH